MKLIKNLLTSSLLINKEIKDCTIKPIIARFINYIIKPMINPIIIPIINPIINPNYPPNYQLRAQSVTKRTHKQTPSIIFNKPAPTTTHCTYEASLMLLFISLVFVLFFFLIPGVFSFFSFVFFSFYVFFIFHFSF